MVSNILSGGIANLFPGEREGRTQTSHSFEEFWRQLPKCERSRLPSRDGYSPHQLKSLLPKLMIVSIDRSIRNSRIRLMGTAIANKFGVDLTNRDYFNLLVENDLANAWASVDSIMEYPCGLWQTMYVHFGDEKGILVEATILPVLGHDGGEQVVCYVDHVKHQLPADEALEVVSIDAATEYEFLDLGYGKPDF